MTHEEIKVDTDFCHAYKTSLSHTLYVHHVEPGNETKQRKGEI